MTLNDIIVRRNRKTNMKDVNVGQVVLYADFRIIYNIYLIHLFKWIITYVQRIDVIRKSTRTERVVNT